MKKIAKLSLVAAIAVAGLTNVNAASLEEAIKGVDVSGQFRFRAQEKSATGTEGSDVEVEVGVKVPVTENVKAVFKIDNAGNKDDSNVAKDGVDIEDYYFSYNSGALTVNAGQQNIPGRLTDGAQGDGIVALYNLGAVTVGAASFMNHNVSTGTQGASANSVIAMGTLGPVSLLGQYVDVDNAAESFNLKADASIAMAKIGAEYSETELDATPSADYSTARAYVSGKVGIVSAKLSYAKTGDQGSGSLHSAAGGAAAGLEAPAEALLWNIGTSGRADYDAVTIDASVAITPAVSLRGAYLSGEQGTGTNNEVTEALAQVSYKVAKNLNTYLRYADVEDQGSEYTRTRVEVRYSF